MNLLPYKEACITFLESEAVRLKGVPEDELRGFLASVQHGIEDIYSKYASASGCGANPPYFYRITAFVSARHMDRHGLPITRDRARGIVYSAINGIAGLPDDTEVPTPEYPRQAGNSWDA